MQSCAPQQSSAPPPQSATAPLDTPAHAHDDAHSAPSPSSHARQSTGGASERVRDPLPIAPSLKTAPSVGAQLRRLSLRRAQRPRPSQRLLGFPLRKQLARNVVGVAAAGLPGTPANEVSHLAQVPVFVNRPVSDRRHLYVSLFDAQNIAKRAPRIKGKVRHDT